MELRLYCNKHRQLGGKAHTMHMHSYKERYGYKMIAAVDHLKRFRYVLFGFSAAASDQMTQDLSDLHRNTELFFSST